MGSTREPLARELGLPFDPDELVARVRSVLARQQRLLTEAARFFADAAVGQGSQGGSGKQNSRGEALQQQFTLREASVLQLVAEGLMNADE